LPSPPHRTIRALTPHTTPATTFASKFQIRSDNIILMRFLPPPMFHTIRLITNVLSLRTFRLELSMWQAELELLFSDHLTQHVISNVAGLNSKI
jgi:hypothetical protein